MQGESLGPAIDIRPGYENFWMYIPHFIHSPFYVYAYAFGDCLVNSLTRSTRTPPKALPSATSPCSRPAAPSIIPNCSSFGLDAKDPKFWDGGLSVISGMIDELEERLTARRPRRRNGFVMGADTFQPPSPAMMTVTTGGSAP